MVMKDFIKEIPPIMRGQLRMPDEARNLLIGKRPDPVPAVINAKSFSKINGILRNLLFNQKNKFLLW